MRKPIDLTAYLVLDPVLCEPIGMVQTAIEAARAGVNVIQLRAPQWKKREIAECARDMQRALLPYHVPLIINDHVDVAMAVNADGVHVGQDDLAPEDARRLLGEEKIIGLSVSTPRECMEVPTDIVDYIGIGPVWATNTKPDAAAPLGLDGLKAFVEHAPCPHVAIGGISLANLAEVKATGAKGFAVVSAICGQDSPYDATRALIELWQKS